MVAQSLAPSTSAWQPLRLHEWCEAAANKPTPTYFLKPIIPADAIVMISGRQKIAKKSYFCRKLALKLATGEAFEPWGAPIAPLPVLFFDQEGPEKLSEQRWRVLERHQKQPLAKIPAFFYLHREPVKLDNDAWVMKVCRFIEDNKIKIVIIDPLAKAHTRDENDEQDLAPVLHAMDRFRERGATVIFVHHLRKEVKKIILAEDIDVDARGSTSLAAHYDVHIGFRATKTEENLVMHVVGKHLEPHSYTVKWDICEESDDPRELRAKVEIKPVKKDDEAPLAKRRKAKPRKEKDDE